MSRVRHLLGLAMLVLLAIGSDASNLCKDSNSFLVPSPGFDREIPVQFKIQKADSFYN